MPSPHGTKRRRATNSIVVTESSANGMISAKPSASHPPTSLGTFISNVFFLVAVQEFDHVFRSTFERFWSHHIQAADNGTPLTFNGFEAFVANLCATVRDRFLVEQSSLVQEVDKEGLTGSVAHSSRIRGVRVEDGVEVEIRVVSVLKVGMREGRNGESKGDRVIETENFVVRVDEKKRDMGD